MTEREMVITALEQAKDEISPVSGSRKARLRDAVDDAIALLKEQEAVEPEVEVLNEIDRIYRCPKCHKFFLYEKQKYCDRCGQEVKWNA